MKRRLFLILIVGILTLGSLLSETQPAFAYCVYNEASDPIQGYDIRHKPHRSFWKADKLDPGTYDCCPSSEASCINRTVRVQWYDQVVKSNRVCQVAVPAKAALVITSQKVDNEDQLICTIQE
jgi:hypothetical protein